MEGMTLNEFGVVTLSTGFHRGNRVSGFEHILPLRIEQGKGWVQGGRLGGRSKLGFGKSGSNSNSEREDEESNEEE